MDSEQKREYLEMGFYLILAVVIALLIVTFIGQRTVVNGSSMVPTLHDRDQLVVYKFLYLYKTPQKGDVVIVWVPPEKRIDKDEKLYIKRVMATENDRIAVKDGEVYLNGNKLSETYINKYGGIYRDQEEVTVPAGHAFVMGDNRGNSRDSREIGFVSYKDIKGKAVFRFWPVKDFGKIK